MLSPVSDKEAEAQTCPTSQSWGPSGGWGVQDRPSHSMGPWNIEYFKLKVFEKKQKQEEHSDQTPAFSPKTGHGTLPVLRGKEGPSLQRPRDTKKSLNMQALLSSPSLLPRFSMTVHSSSNLA